MSPAQLGVASDVFALGLIYTEFLTGAPPPFDVATYHEPAVAVAAAKRSPSRAPASCRNWPIWSTRCSPLTRFTGRPSSNVHATLMVVRATPDDPAHRRRRRPSSQVGCAARDCAQRRQSLAMRPRGPPVGSSASSSARSVIGTGRDSHLAMPGL